MLSKQNPRQQRPKKWKTLKELVTGFKYELLTPSSLRERLFWSWTKNMLQYTIFGANLYLKSPKFKWKIKYKLNTFPWKNLQISNCCNFLSFQPILIKFSLTNQNNHSLSSFVVLGVFPGSRQNPLFSLENSAYKASPKRKSQKYHICEDLTLHISTKSYQTMPVMSKYTFPNFGMPWHFCHMFW